ncbi:MAG: SDR family oxidoreductase [Chloroflexota bacterium]|nr:SDR family oxidoreductase [Chloroflexota bacterium]MDE2962224.1 SDR family oxidoreductase [Chloroflexota bacterium]
MADTTVISDNPRICLTGATGYVGGRLLSILQRDGYRVRCIARRPENLRSPLSETTEAVRGDLLDRASLVDAMRGQDVAFYLVHSMGSSGDFAEEERRCAENFAEAARETGVRRIIYLGGLGSDGRNLSDHLSSRRQVGDILRGSEAQVIEFRASIVIGSGGVSFEMVRALVERLPVMVTPRWVSVAAQPIAINDLLEYLRQSITIPLDGNRIFEIGGADVVSYGDLMREYARLRRLRRVMLPVPALTPRLSSLWLGLVTPLYARVGRKLIDSLRNASVVTDPAASEAFPIQPMGIRDAIAAAMRNEDREVAETRWSDALSSSGKARTWGGVRFGTRLVDKRSATVPVAPQEAFTPVKRIGGDVGWYFGNSLWRMRGFIDLLVGGVGVRRGRRDPSDMAVGDTVDWWRVEKYEPGRMVRFCAEMKLPGRAWLQFEVTPSEDGSGSVVHQTAEFDPVGLGGLVYWYALWPAHAAVFRGMLRNIAKAARQSNAK